MWAMPVPLLVTIKGKGRSPQLHAASWMAPNATLTAQVGLTARASVWCSARSRAEAEPIEIGFGTHIQDRVVVHADPGFPVRAGTGVTVGHNAVVYQRLIEVHRDACG